MNQLIDDIREIFRVILRQVARWLHSISNGKITADAITIFGLCMHVPIAILIARGRFISAGLLLIVFGLFDTLDGELARTQKRTTARGMLLDASTDRIKEVILYTGVAYYLAAGPHPEAAMWAVLACGASLCVSYVKAKGEAIVATSKNIVVTKQTLNKLFIDGLLRFEIRMFLLILGLLFGQLFFATASIAVLSAFTVVQRIVAIAIKLK